MEQTFEEGELRMSSLINAILESPEYQIGMGLGVDDPRFTNARRILNSHQMASAIREITGFSWEEDNVELMENDSRGFRVLAGGLDGRTVIKWQDDPSASRQLTLKRLTQLAADHVVETAWMERMPVFQNRMLSEVTSDDDSFTEIVTSLHRRILAENPTVDRLQLDADMWSNIANQSSEKQAWKSFVSVLLRDSEAWIY